jgi:RNA polymerase sigma-B factor
VSGTAIDRDRMAALIDRLPDTDARAELFAVTRPLVRALAGRFRGRGEPLDDLIQVASMGMLKAIDNFDHARGSSLLAYATAVIVGELRHHFRDSVRLMRIPRPLVQARRRVDEATEELAQRLGRSPTVPELAAATGLEEEAVLEAIGTVTASTPVSIDEIGDTDGDGAVAESDGFGLLDDLHTVSMSLAGLPERERRILFLRFFRGYTQAEVAEDIGVSQVQVSRILSASLQRIREEVAGDQS